MGEKTTVVHCFVVVSPTPNKWPSAGEDRRDKKDGPLGQQPMSGYRDKTKHNQQDWTRSSSIRNNWGSFRKDAGRVGWNKRKVSKGKCLCRMESLRSSWLRETRTVNICVNRYTSPYNELPFLSPVSTQILMSAFASFEMVSGTPSCSLSSIAVAPKSWNVH